MLPFAGKNRVTSIFGTRTLNGKTASHKGLDIVGDNDRRVLAVKGGTVQQSRMVTDKSNATWEWGNYVCILAEDGNLYYYCHMDSRTVNAGDKVAAGQQIGVMGNTGKSFGAHLHFEVRNSAKASIDPCPILGISNATGVYANDKAGAAPLVPAGGQAPPAAGSASTKKFVTFGVGKGINV